MSIWTITCHYTILFSFQNITSKMEKYNSMDTVAYVCAQFIQAGINSLKYGTIMCWGGKV